jgi:predicted esterase
MNSFLKNLFTVFILIAMTLDISAQNSFTGTWLLNSSWEKEDAESQQMVTINKDLTGTVKYLSEGWESELQNVKLNGDALTFSFYWEGNKDYEVKFKGTVDGKEIEGEFEIWGAKAAVTGKQLSAEEAAEIAAQPTIYDIYEARNFTDSKNVTLDYWLFVPENYDPNKKYPVILFHHGGGGGSLGGELIKEWILPEVQNDNPCFIFSPQFPAKDAKSMKDGTFTMRGFTRAIHEALDALEKEFSIDKNREYVTGLSFGGECTWLSLVMNPQRFAAGVPICGTDVYTDMTVTERVGKAGLIPVWIFHGDADETVPVDVSRNIVKKLKEAGGNPIYTEYPGVGHDSWSRAYRDPELVKWLFAQKRRS